MLGVHTQIPPFAKSARVVRVNAQVILNKHPEHATSFIRTVSERLPALNSPTHRRTVCLVGVRRSETSTLSDGTLTQVDNDVLAAASCGICLLTEDKVVSNR